MCSIEHGVGLPDCQHLSRVTGQGFSIASASAGALSAHGGWFVILQQRSGQPMGAVLSYLTVTRTLHSSSLSRHYKLVLKTVHHRPLPANATGHNTHLTLTWQGGCSGRARISRGLSILCNFVNPSRSLAALFVCGGCSRQVSGWLAVCRIQPYSYGKSLIR